jgi:general stress protein YciG
MQKKTDPKDPKPKKGSPANDKNRSEPAGREGGDDSLTESSPTDSRLDEKVIVNEQRSEKIVNAPSQTAANTSENTGSDEEIVNG